MIPCARYFIPRHGDGTTRINVGTLSAGTGRNVIPDHAVTQLETRGETRELDEYVAPGIVRAACEGSGNIKRVLPEAAIGDSEDAMLMMERVWERCGKATYMLFGSPLTAGHHHPAFDWDEEAMVVVVEALARSIRCLCAA